MSDDKVRLKPFLGIKPGGYLACIYGTILLVILFFIFLFPGLKNPGSLLMVKSEPWGAAILVDGVYMDFSPAEVFVSRGLRQIEIRLPGFQPEIISLDIRGRVFASALIPTKISIEQELQVINPVEAFLNEAAEFTAWTFAGEPLPSYQIPLSLSEGVYRLGPAAQNSIVRQSMEDTLNAAARFAVTRASLRDLIRSKTLLDNQGLSPSPISLLGSLEDIIVFLDKNQKSALWLADLLINENQTTLMSSAWFRETASFEIPVQIQQIPAQAFIQTGNFNFRMVDNTFYISDTLINTTVWETFLLQHPEWSRENIITLLEDGLVSEDYLITISGAPAEGVSGISWYAASAFCQWLNRYINLPPLYNTWEIRLPTETEWENAVKNGAINYGLFWEWCIDPFSPLNFLSAPSDTIEALGSPERSLRGGSWLNIPGSVGIETRASLPPSFSSPFVSFRPVLAPRGAQF